LKDDLSLLVLARADGRLREDLHAQQSDFGT
jgi:hypothetical protein